MGTTNTTDELQRISVERQTSVYASKDRLTRAAIQHAVEEYKNFYGDEELPSVFYVNRFVDKHAEPGENNSYWACSFTNTHWGVEWTTMCSEVERLYKECDPEIAQLDLFWDFQAADDTCVIYED